jgi:hypothetical protein
LPERIQAIPDGITAAASHTGGWAATSNHPHIKFDTPGNHCYRYETHFIEMYMDYEITVFS